MQRFQAQLPQILSYIPSHLIEEMQGISVGADVSFKKVLMMNLFPEMFHCIGITLQGEATHDHFLYHVRVLDYSIGKNLQKNAVLIVVKPNGKKSYLSVSYAGFIGVITGMNEEKIAIGEISGDQYGPWEGVPMAFLLKEVLENALSLNEAQKILENTSRVSEYYYVISDGKIEESIGVYATHNHLCCIGPGESDSLLTPNNMPQYSKRKAAIFNDQPKNCILLGGFDSLRRYSTLTERMQKEYGFIDHIACQRIILPPVTNDTNLHNAIFHPSSLDVWVSNMGLDRTPVSQSCYTHFNLMQLLNFNP